MEEYFKLPTGYACLERSSDQIRAYTSDYRTRDVYELDNFKWLKVSTSTSNYTYTPGTCLPSSEHYLIPTSVSGSVLICIFIAIGLLIAGLFSIFRR